MARTKNYSDYLTRISGLIGIPVSGFQSDELAFLAGYFQTNYNEVWQRSNWIDNSPYGEARFVGNKTTYPNDMTQVAAWGQPSTNGFSSVTANAVLNPLDGRTSASSLKENTGFNPHSVAQHFAAYPATSYSITAYVRPNGRQWCYVSGDIANFFAFFDLINGVTGTISSGTQATISQVANGFYRCQITYTTATGSLPTTGGVLTVGVSTANQTFPIAAQYSGDVTKGFYLWGVTANQTSNTGPEDLLLRWDQDGEEVIDVAFEVWTNNPKNQSLPWRQPYEITPDGLQMLAPGGGWYNAYYSPPVTATATIAATLPPNPVYLYYRKQSPDFEGSAYDATASYGVRDQILFTDSSNVQNYWKCIVAAPPGQSPSASPTSWSVIPILDVFFKYTVFGAYADWLRQDGQFEKAQAADANAEDQINTEFDQQERQMGWIQPIRYQTHVTSQPRN